MKNAVFDCANSSIRLAPNNSLWKYTRSPSATMRAGRSSKRYSPASRRLVAASPAIAAFSITANSGQPYSAARLLRISSINAACKVPTEDIHVLSLGTNVASPRHSVHENPNLGALGWLRNGRLYTTMSSAQRELTDSILHHIIERRYQRIEGTPDTSRDGLLQFDNASLAASKRLTKLAEHAWKHAYADASFKLFIEMLRQHRIDDGWRATVPTTESVDSNR